MFERGYSDGLRGRQRVLGNEAYREGYRAGVRYRVTERRVTLFSAGAVVLALSFAIAGMPV